MELKTIII